jgi:protein O-mannosyl-transferase
VQLREFYSAKRPASGPWLISFANMQNDSRQQKIIYFALGIITLALYWQVTSFEFTNYDDPDYVLQNPYVQSGLTRQGILWAFKSSYACNWHPLTWISHMLDCQLFGLNPGLHHLTSLFFHIANSLLLFGLLRRMTGDLWKSACVAALFAWHPLHVESVAWIAERKDVLSTFFFLLSLGAYDSYVKKPSFKRYLALVLFFAFGLMSKPMLVTLPCVLLLLDFWPLQRISWKGQPARTDAGQQLHSPGKLVLEKLPLFILAGIVSYLNMLAQKAGNTVISLDVLPPLDRLSDALVSYARYLGKTFWPSDLAVLYPFHDSWGLWQVAGAATVLLIITGFILANSQRHQYLAVGWLWFIGTMVPVIGLVQVGLQSMADRYTYIPLIGIFIILVWGLSEWLRNRSGLRTASLFLASIILAVCVSSSWFQLQHWRNSVTLFGHAVSVTRNNIRASYNLAQALDAKGRKEEAIAQYLRTLQLKPNRLEARFNSQIDAHYNLGIILAGKEQFEAARQHFQAALNGRPEHLAARNNLGNVLMSEGHLDEAVEQFQAVLKSAPQHPMALHNLALALGEKGDYPAAIASFRELIQLHPEDAIAHYDFGVALAATSEFAASIEQYEESLQLQPRLVNAQVGWADVLIQQGRPEEAAVHYNAALSLQPDLVWRLNELTPSLIDHGRFRRAEALLQSALRINPLYSTTHLNLGMLSLRQNKTREAVAYLRKAIELNASDSKAMGELAWVLATCQEATVRNGAEALRLAERACAMVEVKDSRLLSILDVAYAETGRFPDAIKTAQKAAELAEASGQSESLAAINKRLALYREGRPYHQ